MGWLGTCMCLRSVFRDFPIKSGVVYYFSSLFAQVAYVGHFC